MFPNFRKDKVKLKSELTENLFNYVIIQVFIGFFYLINVEIANHKIKHKH